MFGDKDLNCLRLQRHDAGRYGFSAIRLKHLDATEFTLVNLAVDSSGSTDEYEGQFDAIVGRVVGAFADSDRKHHLLLRLVAFDHVPREVHGFKPLSECDPADYKGIFNAAGTTALTDAALNGVEAVSGFGRYLMENDLWVNGLSIVVTDGMDLQSRSNPEEINKVQAEAMERGNVESLTSILAGVCGNAPPGMSRILMEFRQIAGFTKYIELGEMSNSTATQLADYIIATISTVNAALRTGEPPRQLPNAGSLETCEDIIGTKKKSRRKRLFPLLYYFSLEPPRKKPAQE